jgi:hypothetical protein
MLSVPLFVLLSVACLLFVDTKAQITPFLSLGASRGMLER